MALGSPGPSPDHQPPAQTSLWSVSQSLYTGRPHTRAATRPPAPSRHLSEAREIVATQADIERNHLRGWVSFPKHDLDLQGHVFDAPALAARHEHTHISDDSDRFVEKSDETDFMLAEAFSAWKSKSTAQYKFSDPRHISRNSALAATAATDVVSATEPARLSSKGAVVLAARPPRLLGAVRLSSLLSTSPAEIQARHGSGCGQELGGMESSQELVCQVAT